MGIAVDAQAPQRVKALMLEYGERAYRFAYSMTGNVDESKDLVAEAFARVLARWNQYDYERPLENWFFAILRHLFLDAVKRFERKASVSLEAPIAPWFPSSPRVADCLAADDEDILQRLEREESEEFVRDALSRLSWEFRSVIILCDMEGMKYEQISHILNCPVGTVRSRLHRARLLLRKMLAELFVEEMPLPRFQKGENNEMP